MIFSIGNKGGKGVFSCIYYNGTAVYLDFHTGISAESAPLWHVFFHTFVFF